jgi:hypothetical protein
MRPSSVESPVATTSPRARPVRTSVPANAIAAVCLCTGRDSPVSRDSSSVKLVAATRRRSAGTLLPDSSSTTSPGTMSPASISRAAPSRSTSARGLTRLRSASAVRSAECSWWVPMSALISTAAKMNAASDHWPSAAETSAAPSSTYMSGLLNWRRNSAASVGGATCGNTLRP